MKTMVTGIDVKQAVQDAEKYFTQLMSVSDVRLEEVEISDDERFWYVTLSGLVPVAKPPSPSDIQSPLSGLESLFRSNEERIYKVFKVDSSSGLVMSMKIRKLE
jgi:hypothetical protein